MRLALASIVLALATLAGCAEDGARTEKAVHVRLYSDGTGDFGCAPTRLELPDQAVTLSCDADGLTMSGTVQVKPDETAVAIVASDAVDVLDRYLEFPAGFAGPSIWASVRIEEHYPPKEP